MQARDILSHKTTAVRWRSYVTRCHTTRTLLGPAMNMKLCHTTQILLSSVMNVKPCHATQMMLSPASYELSDLSLRRQLPQVAATARPVQIKILCNNLSHNCEPTLNNTVERYLTTPKVVYSVLPQQLSVGQRNSAQRWLRPCWRLWVCRTWPTCVRSGRSCWSTTSTSQCQVGIIFCNEISSEIDWKRYPQNGRHHMESPRTPQSSVYYKLFTKKDRFLWKPDVFCQDLFVLNFLAGKSSFKVLSSCSYFYT